MPTHWDTNSEPIPGYRLIERIGRGGYGEVWKAEAPGGILKAVKLVYGDLGATDSSDRQAKRELGALQKVRSIRHPFVLSIERFDIIDGQLVIVSELADRDLSRRLFECRDQGLLGIPRAELLRYMHEAADALDTLNRRFGLQHLDIKPQNLFLVGDHIKVADFGLVKAFDGRAAAFTGGVTPIYACPESFDGWVSRNSDQYSLAIVFQEMLTGRLPFPGPSPRQFMLQHLTHEPDLELLDESDRVAVKRALSKHPDGRFPSCMDFVRALLPETGFSKRTISYPVQTETDNTYCQTSGDPMVWTKVSAEQQDEAVDELSNPTISPPRHAIVIGLGRTGIECLKRIAENFQIRSLESVEHISLQLIGIDSREDTTDISRWETGDLEAVTVHCPLRKGNSYLQNWERCSHLKDWLNPNLLFHVSGDGSSNGQRGLGRLAFVDNQERIEQVLQEQLAALASHLTAVRPELRIFIVTSMAGGTGSGMFVDVCYLVRKQLAAQHVGRAEITGVLVSEPSDKSKPQRCVNQWALIDEIDQLCQPGVFFTPVAPPGKSPAKFACPPCDQFLVCSFDDRTEGTTSATRAAEMVSELVVTSAVHRLFEPDRMAKGMNFSSVGWLQVEYPEQRLLEAVSRKLATLLCDQWCRPLPSRDAAKIYQEAEKSMRTAGFDAEAVMYKVQGLVDSLLETPLHVELAQRLAELEQSLRFDDPDTMATAFETTLQGICQSIGSEWDFESADPRLTPLVGVAQAAVDKACRELSESITLAASESLNSPGPRWSRAEVVVSGFNDFLLKMLDRNHQQIRVERQALSRRARSILDQAQLLRTPENNHPRFVMAILTSLEEYGRAKILLRLREMSVQVYLRLRNKMTQIGHNLSLVRLQLNRWRQALAVELPVPESTAVTQQIFPKKQLRFRDAQQEILSRLTARGQIEKLDQFVDTRTLGALGGLWEIALSDEETEASFLPIEAAIQQWVTAHLPASDATQCLVELHGGDVSRLSQTMQTFFEWAAPGDVNRSAGQMQTLVMVPPGRAGDTLLSAIRPAIVGTNNSVLRTGTRLVICQRIAAGSFRTVMPQWLYQFQDLYHEKCQGRTSPRVLALSAAQHS